MRSTLLIDGEWQAAVNGFDVIDPATTELIGVAADATDDHAHQATAAAARAFAGWRDVDAETRGGYLRRAAAAFRENLPALADILSRENGKPIPQAEAEVLSSARMLEWAAEEGRRAYGRVTPAAAHGGPGFVLTAPVGPTFAISPWNYPMSMIVRKIGLALASGSTVIAKPAKKTPFTSEAAVRLIQDTGLPPGVLQHLTAARSGRLSAAVLADDRIRKVTFTGSTEVGHGLLRANERLARRFSLELGGHAPGIVFSDADLDVAADAIAQVKFVNAGQICIAINRLYVHRSVLEPLVDRLKTRAQALVIGHGVNPATTLGPLIDDDALRKVEEHVDDAVVRGATVVTGGRRWIPDRPELRGAFYEPTILTGVDESMIISREETFGPVLPIFVFDDDDDAIARANDSEFGLASYLFGRDFTRLWRAMNRLEFGVIGVNDPFIVRPDLPFGGLKNSGQEREGGIEGIEAFLEHRAVAMRLLPPVEPS